MTKETAEAAGLATLIQRAKELSAGGHYQTALPLWTTALQVAKETVGERHARVLFLTEELADCLEHLNRWAPAAYHWSMAFNLSRDLRGLNDECTGTIARRAGVACLRLNQRTRAVPLWETALAISRRLYGDTNPTTLFCIKNLARCLASLRQNQRVIALTEPLCQAFFDGVPLPPKYSEPIFHSLAQSLTATSRHARAVKYWRTYSILCSAHYGDGDRITMNAWREWGCALGKSGRRAEAVTVLTRCRELAATLYGADHQVTREMVGLIGRYESARQQAA